MSNSNNIEGLPIQGEAPPPSSSTFTWGRVLKNEHFWEDQKKVEILKANLSEFAGPKLHFGSGNTPVYFFSSDSTCALQRLNKVENIAVFGHFCVFWPRCENKMRISKASLSGNGSGL